MGSGFQGLSPKDLQDASAVFDQTNRVVAAAGTTLSMVARTDWAVLGSRGDRYRESLGPVVRRSDQAATDISALIQKLLANIAEQVEASGGGTARTATRPPTMTRGVQLPSGEQVPTRPPGVDSPGRPPAVESPRRPSGGHVPLDPQRFPSGSGIDLDKLPKTERIVRPDGWTGTALRWGVRGNAALILLGAIFVPDSNDHRWIYLDPLTGKETEFDSERQMWSHIHERDEQVANMGFVGQRDLAKYQRILAEQNRTSEVVLPGAAESPERKDAPGQGPAVPIDEPGAQPEKIAPPGTEMPAAIAPPPPGSDGRIEASGADDKWQQFDAEEKERLRKLNDKLRLDLERGIDYRDELSGIHGEPPADGQEYRAHHPFPVKYHDKFKNAGIDTADPKWGSWAERRSHEQFSDEYNRAWDAFFKVNQNPSRAHVLNFARDLARKHQYQLPWDKLPWAR